MLTTLQGIFIECETKMRVKELIEKLKEYDETLIVEIGFNPLELDKDRKIVIPEPEFELEVKYNYNNEDESSKAFDYLRIF